MNCPLTNCDLRVKCNSHTLAKSDNELQNKLRRAEASVGHLQGPRQLFRVGCTHSILAIAPAPSAGRSEPGGGEHQARDFIRNRSGNRAAGAKGSLTQALVTQIRLILLMTKAQAGGPVIEVLIHW